MQLPIGLVPKTGNKTRLIFHLSHDFNEFRSINAYTPKENCSVKYNDLDVAVRLMLCKLQNARRKNKFKQIIFCGKTDLSSAFRLLPLNKNSWSLLVMQASDLETGEQWFFFDKCLPFGSSISCSHFQRFSDALKHVFTHVAGPKAKDSIINYLDDFLFIALGEKDCNYLVETFLKMCAELNIPVALEKTEWATSRIIFLGILIDGVGHVLSIPEEKRIRAVKMLQYFIQKRKAKVKEMQKLAGFLNFLNRAIVPGRAFTRRMYAKF